MANTEFYDAIIRDAFTVAPNRRLRDQVEENIRRAYDSLADQCSCPFDRGPIADAISVALLQVTEKATPSPPPPPPPPAAPATNRPQLSGKKPDPKAATFTASNFDWADEVTTPVQDSPAVPQSARAPTMITPTNSQSEIIRVIGDGIERLLGQVISSPQLVNAFIKEMVPTIRSIADHCREVAKSERRVQEAQYANDEAVRREGEARMRMG